MQGNILVTGANGHIGNNLVRHLLRQNLPVRAAVRTPSAAPALHGLDCPVVALDMLDRASLADGMRDIDVLFHSAAVFRQWAKDPGSEIYAANMEGTRNVMEAAAKAGVRRIVYVSSLVALDRNVLPITEATWNNGTDNVYARSKTHAEQLACMLARKYGLDMVSVLPSSTVGAHCYRLTPTMGLMSTILNGKLRINPGFSFNFIDVDDVAAGLIAAANRGRSGERYLLANENWMGVNEMVRLAQDVVPQGGIHMPPQVPHALLWTIAALMELAGRVSGNEPKLQRNHLTEFTVRERCDISKARRDLGHMPKSPQQAVQNAYRWLRGSCDALEPASTHAFSTGR